PAILRLGPAAPAVQVTIQESMLPWSNGSSAMSLPDMSSLETAATEGAEAVITAGDVNAEARAEPEDTTAAGPAAPEPASGAAPETTSAAPVKRAYPAPAEVPTQKGPK